MKVLGVVFGTVSCEEDNWEPKIKKSKNPLIYGGLGHYPSWGRLSLLIVSVKANLFTALRCLFFLTGFLPG